MNAAAVLEPPAKAYKVICISIYTADLAELDQKVEALKARGIRHVNRSSLIRYALDQLDLDQVPKAM